MACGPHKFMSYERTLVQPAPTSWPVSPKQILVWGLPFCGPAESPLLLEDSLGFDPCQVNPGSLQASTRDVE